MEENEIPKQKEKLLVETDQEASLRGTVEGLAQVTLDKINTRTKADNTERPTNIKDEEQLLQAEAQRKQVQAGKEMTEAHGMTFYFFNAQYKHLKSQRKFFLVAVTLL